MKMHSLDEMMGWLKEKEELLGDGKIIPNPALDVLSEGTRPIIIYGAGAVGHDVYDNLYKNNIVPQFFCSGLKSGYVDSFTGLHVIHKDDLAVHNNGVVILAIGDKASGGEKKQLKKDFVSMGFHEDYIMDHYVFEEKVSPSFLLEHKEEIADVYHILSDDESRRVYLQKLKYMVEYVPVGFECFHTMYTDESIIQFDKNEVIIDAGAYDGDSALMFRNNAGATADIYSFEPDVSNYNNLINRVCNEGKIYPENLGLWKCKDTLLFSDDSNGSSHVEETGRLTVKVTDLDSYCSEKGIIPTYIKMDIEGAEVEAILGAKEMIRKGKPKLAICLYHRTEDIYKIPLLVHKLNPLYEMFIRHYSDCRTDTVLYAV